jgi:hypothetical protein
MSGASRAHRLSFAKTSSESLDGPFSRSLVRTGSRRQEVVPLAGRRKTRFSVRQRTAGGRQSKDGARSVLGPAAGAGLRGPTKIAMVQAADFWKLHDLADRGELDEPDVGCVLVEREVRASPLIVADVTGQDAAQVSLAENENVIQALAPDRADAPLRERILPRAVRGGKDFLDTHPLHAVPKLLAVDLVAIAEEIGRCAVVREGVDDLLSSPVGGGMLGHVEVYDPSVGDGERARQERRARASLQWGR